MKRYLVGIVFGVFVSVGPCFADESQDARQVKQYLENVLGSGVQVNIARETLSAASQQRRRTHENPQLDVQKSQQTTRSKGTEASTQRASQNHFQYDTTETLTQLPPVLGPRSVTVVYPFNANATEAEETSATGYSPAEVKSLVSDLLSMKANEKLVVEAYTPPTAIPFAPVKGPQIWLWAVACVFLGLLLGLGAAFYWRKRQQQKKIAYNAFNDQLNPDQLNPGYPLYHPSEESISYAPELQ
jgi:hypothetical protein